VKATSEENRHARDNDHHPRTRRAQRAPGRAQLHRRHRRGERPRRPAVPRPGSDPGQVRRYFTQNPGEARLSAAGQAIPAASLARFTASAARPAGRTGPGSRALQAAAVAGGALAAASLAASAACTAALSARWSRREASAAALARRGFLAGGVIHSPAFGVLLGTLGLAGVRTGELPRPMAITALASASACLPAPLYLVAGPFAWLIPAGRFPGLVVASGIAGARLARSQRPDR
jgi:hypothetical protein